MGPSLRTPPTPPPPPPTTTITTTNHLTAHARVISGRNLLNLFNTMTLQNCIFIRHLLFLHTSSPLPPPFLFFFISFLLLFFCAPICDEISSSNDEFHSTRGAR